MSVVNQTNQEDITTILLLFNYNKCSFSLKPCQSTKTKETQTVLCVFILCFNVFLLRINHVGIKC